MKPIAHAVVSSLLCASALAHEAARPKITGIARVRLYATNLERSRDFYAKISENEKGRHIVLLFLCQDTRC